MHYLFDIYSPLYLCICSNIFSIPNASVSITIKSNNLFISANYLSFFFYQGSNVTILSIFIVCHPNIIKERRAVERKREREKKKNPMFRFQHQNREKKRTNTKKTTELWGLLLLFLLLIGSDDDDDDKLRENTHNRQHLPWWLLVVKEESNCSFCSSCSSDRSTSLLSSRFNLAFNCLAKFRLISRRSNTRKKLI
jgi:hypothetical protein